MQILNLLLQEISHRLIKDPLNKRQFRKKASAAVFKNNIAAAEEVKKVKF